MSRTIPTLLLIATTSFAAVPVSFTSGTSAKAADVNMNFNYLDSAVGKKASQASLDAVAEALKNKADASALSGKADGSLKDSVANLRASVNAKADANALSSVQASVATLQSSKVDTSALRLVRDTVRNKANQADLSAKKDSAWIVKAINGKLPTGTLVASNNLSDVTNPATARTNLGLKSLATSDTIAWNKVSTIGANASDVGALPTTAVSGTVNSVPKFTAAGAIGNSGIVDDGTTISINPPNSSNFRFSQLVGGPGYGAIYGYTPPTASNFILKTTGDNSLTTLNGGTVTLASGGKDVISANTWGAAVNGNLSASGSITLPYCPQESTTGATKGNTMLIGNAADLGESGGYELTVALPTNATHWPFGIYKGGSRIFNVDVDGNTAIAGNLYVSRSITTGAGSTVPDYVFEPGYKLASLSEVEAFTKQYKHLPEVPSATEIEQGGMDLAKMNLILLKKVEELTLHTIELEKRLNAVEASAKP